MNVIFFRKLCFGLLLSHFTQYTVVSAQEQPVFTVTPNANLPEFVTIIDGSKNPELIDDNTIYNAFAGFW